MLKRDCRAIFNVDGTICAIADTCPHVGGSLGLGKLNGRIATCPAHGMKFDVTTGCFAGTSDFGVASFPAKVVEHLVPLSKQSLAILLEIKAVAGSSRYGFPGRNSNKPISNNTMLFASLPAGV